MAALLRTGDRWWGGTALLFSGRWPWVLPLVPLAVLAVASRRLITLGLLTLATAIGAFWVLGASLGLGRLLAGGDPATSVRIITYNVGGGKRAVANLGRLIEEWKPDLVAFQECGPVIEAAMAEFQGYRAYLGAGCLMSRFPVTSVDPLPRRDVQAAGGSGIVIRYRIEGPGGAFDLTNVHLETPRQGLESLLSGDPAATAMIREETLLRAIESRQARRWVDEGPGPRLVVGDFNLPTESAIYREHWSDLTEAFAAAGFGLGATKRTGLIRLRIDHVLADEAWVVRSARVLPDYGSDHRPVLVELRRR